ncbi:MAG TPA: hypothetical protein VEG65_05885 [Candidatus Bathyarchaeia archaeon]|nr:hypothetical protein [Candidatus Bathyarchaeia archaeon]
MAQSSARNSPSVAVIRLSFWSAVLTTVFAAAFLAVGIATSVRNVPYPYIPSFISGDYLWMYPAFLLAPTVVVLVASIHYRAVDDKKVFRLIAVSFAIGAAE